MISSRQGQISRESGLAWYNRTQRNRLHSDKTWPLRTGLRIKGVDFELTKGDTLEIVGVMGTGKTEIIYQAVLACAMPETFAGVQLNGKGSGVVFFDLDYRFTFVRFESLLDRYLHEAFKREHKDYADFLGTQSHQKLQDEVFERIKIVTAETPAEFLHALQQVGGLTYDDITENKNRCVPNKSMIDVASTALVVIDGLTAFWYYHAMFSPQKKDEFYKRVERILSAILKDCDMCSIITKQVLFKSQIAGITEKKDREIFGQNWTKLITHRLMLKDDRNGSYLGHLQTVSYQGLSYAPQLQQNNNRQHHTAMDFRYTIEFRGPVVQ